MKALEIVVLRFMNNVVLNKTQDVVEIIQKKICELLEESNSNPKPSL